MKPDGATSAKTFKVYRWNPDDGRNPRMDTYEVDLDTCSHPGNLGLEGYPKNRRCSLRYPGSCAACVSGWGASACGAP